MKYRTNKYWPTALVIGFLMTSQMLFAQGNEEVIESIFVTSERRAYQANFDNLENPAANQIIDSQLLQDAGVLNLNDALDLSASVARQNNFGGLWNSFFSSWVRGGY